MSCILKNYGLFYDTFFNNYIFLVNNFWLALPWGHDVSAVPVLADSDRGPMCGAGINQNDIIKLTEGYPSV